MRTVIALALFALAAPFGAEAGHKTLSLKWSEAPARLTGKHLRAVLADGVRLEGRAASVGAEALIIEVSKSSDPARLHKSAAVRRPELAALEVRKSGWVWKVAAPILGCVSFGLAGAAIGNKVDPHGFIISDGAANGAVAGMAAGIGVGLLAGWFADRHYVLVEIVP